MNRLLTTTELIASSIISLLLILILNAKNIFDKFFNNIDIATVISDSSFVASFTSRISELITKIFTPNVATLVFWFIIGLISYVIFELLIDDSKGIKDIFLIGTSYRHPSNFSYAKYWLSVLIGLVESMVLIATFILWMFLMFSYFVPFSMSSFLVALSDISALYFVYSFLGLFTSIVGLIVLFKLFKIYKFN